MSERPKGKEGLEDHLRRMEKLDAREIALQKRIRMGDLSPDVMSGLRDVIGEKIDAQIDRSHPVVDHK